MRFRFAFCLFFDAERKMYVLSRQWSRGFFHRSLRFFAFATICVISSEALRRSAFIGVLCVRLGFLLLPGADMNLLRTQNLRTLYILLIIIIVCFCRNVKLIFKRGPGLNASDTGPSKRMPLFCMKIRVSSG